MAEDVRMALVELLRKTGMAENIDFLREGVRVLAQALMELEVTEHVSAERHERSAARSGQCIGYRDWDWDTRVGRSSCGCPASAMAAFPPPCSSPGAAQSGRWWRSCRKPTWPSGRPGVSTRRMDDLVKALGLDGISKRQVSRVCQARDAEVLRWSVPAGQGHDDLVMSAALVAALDGVDWRPRLARGSGEVVA